MPLTKPDFNILGLDVGAKRVGVALVRQELRLPVALDTLERQNADFLQKLDSLVQDYDIGTVVVGWPRGLDGQETDQTRSVQTFVDELATRYNLPVHTQDEALTSVKAEELLKQLGKPYEKHDIDSMAAVIITDDFLKAQGI